jgi:electron transport complex protein RnfB
MGLGSIKLQVRHNLCVDCNQCAIATACPVDAFERLPAGQKPPGR